MVINNGNSKKEKIFEEKISGCKVILNWDLIMNLSLFFHGYVILYLSIL